MLVAVACGLGLILMGAFELISQWEEEGAQTALEEAEEANTGSITYVYFDGQAYIPKEQITTLLLLGIDNEGKMKSSGIYYNEGQNDFNALLVLDESTDTYTLLQINRDTMTAVQRLGVDGTVAGTYTEQLALAHTYGDGMEASCENVVTAVENLLYGIEIDHYFAMNMTAVELMVDAIGGVTVTIRDDFSAVDDTMVQGETMLLNGAQTVTYIRARKDVGDQTNLSRSERQRDFLYQLLAGMQSKKSIALSELINVADYILTDLSATRLNRLFEKICDAECLDIITPDGEAVQGEEYMEFYTNDDSLKEMVISLFYTPVE